MGEIMPVLGSELRREHAVNAAASALRLEQRHS
jgi:hypothetical protein